MKYFNFDIQIYRMRSVTVLELKQMIDNNEDFQLIDVREPHENEICTLNGLLIPLAEIPNNINAINKEGKVIIQCRSGARSGNAVHFLEDNYAFDNLYNLTGGILAWAKEIDPTMETY
jgi:rhodanese-related sulfurtransferase